MIEQFLFIYDFVCYLIYLHFYVVKYKTFKDEFLLLKSWFDAAAHIK